MESIRDNPLTTECKAAMAEEARGRAREAQAEMDRLRRGPPAFNATTLPRAARVLPPQWHEQEFMRAWSMVSRAGNEICRALLDLATGRPVDRREYGEAARALYDALPALLLAFDGLNSMVRTADRCDLEVEEMLAMHREADRLLAEYDRLGGALERRVRDAEARRGCPRILRPKPLEETNPELAALLARIGTDKQKATK